MNLALHQLRLEFRRSRFPLSLYFLILLCNYAVAAGWIGIPEAPTDRQWMVGGAFPVLLVMAYWIAFAVIVSNCVLADSPARQDRFLHTRPLPAGSLVTAKSLYILLAAVLPAALVEAASTATVGGPATLVIHAALERALFCGALAVAVAAFAAHWRNTQGLVLAAVIGFAAVMILGRLLIELARSLGALRDPLDGEPTYLTAVQAFLVAGAGLGLTAWICSRRGRKFRYLVPALLPILLAALYVLTSSPWRTAPFRPSDQGRIDKLLSSGTAEAKVVSHGFNIGKPQNQPELHATFSFAPITSGIPKDLELRWNPVNHRWLVEGKVARHDNTDVNRLGTHYVSSDAVPISWSLAQAIQGHLGSAVRFQFEQGHLQHTSRLSAHSLEYLPEGPRAGREASVDTEVVGDAFAWKIAADLPLPAKEDLPLVDSESGWQIAALIPSLSEFRIMMSETVVALHTAGNINHRGGRRRWGRTHQFVLYLPGENVALFGEAGYERPLASVSAAKRYFGSVQFAHPHMNPLTPRRLDGARLLILQNEYVGRIETEFTSPKFTLLKRRTHRGGTPSPYEPHEMLSAAEFALWFHRWKKLSPDQPAERVQAHLEILLEQTARLERRLHSAREPALIHAATFVPRHLDFMLEKLPELSHPAAQFLVAAIAQGAEESQRQKIVRASVAEDSLAAVATERGWYKDSRETLITMARDYLNSGSRFTHGLLALNDPALDALILDSYRANPQPHLYELLRSNPRLAPEAERLTDEFWKPGRFVMVRGRPQGLLSFALLQGKPEALDELFAALRVSAQDSRVSEHTLSSLITGSIHVPKEGRGGHNDPKAIVKWALQYDSTDFVFDPVFRRFVLRATASTF